MGERDMYESKWMAENQRIASPSNITALARAISSYEPVVAANSSSLLELDALPMNWSQEIPSNDHLTNWFPSPNPMHALKQKQIKSELYLISSKHRLSPQTDEASSRSLVSIVNNQLLSYNEAQSQKPSLESSSIASQQKRAVSTVPALKLQVRKEKLGDRITTLQQLVSPFGKTDTASVLLDTIEYIKSLHDQVNVLFAPYSRTNHGIVKGENDLTSRGLCLVPISTVSNAAYDTSTDVWTPTFSSTAVQVINQQSALPQSY